MTARCPYCGSAQPALRIGDEFVARPSRNRRPIRWRVLTEPARALDASTGRPFGPQGGLYVWAEPVDGRGAVMVWPLYLIPVPAGA